MTDCMTLTGSQFKQLTDALIYAFPEPIRLDEVLRFRFNKRLNTYAMGDDFRAIVFRLITAVEAEGWIDKLVVGARESNPGNPKLFVIAQELNLATPMPSELTARGSLERIIRQTNSFLNVNTWRETLGKLESQVCRIEITQNNRQSFGTGFLIAPNVVITNYHVIEPLLSKQATSNNVILRFDFKQIDGRIINQGTEYRLVNDEWLIDESPYLPDNENRLPTPDELDYALLRVDGVPGREAIGTNPDPNSPERGWIKLTDEIYEFVPDTPLFILQHPQGGPLKLGFDTESIIGVNENGTTVRYRTNTECGSSGSPCFDINWKLVALHHSGDPAYEGAEYNAGTPISAICSRLKQQGLWQDLLSGEEISSIRNNNRLDQDLRTQPNVQPISLINGAQNNEISFQYVSPRDNSLFEFYITTHPDYPYWQESDKPPRGREEYPFARQCVQYFYLDEKYFFDNTYPLFDITFINKNPEYIMLTDIGIEIVTISHLMYFYGAPEAVEVKIQSEYTIDMPNILAELDDGYTTQNYPNPSDPIDFNKVVSVRMPSPFYLESQAPFRYTLWLDKYQEHMPNNAILRMWVRTSKKIEFRSHEIHLFTF